MNKKILVGVSAIFVAAGFWACGNGDIITKGEDEKTAEIVDEEMINQLKDKAIKDCQESPECEAKMADADKIPEPESSGDGGDTPTPGGDDEGGNGGNGGNGSGPVPTTSTSRQTPSSNPSTGSSGSSDQPPTSSPSTVTDASVPNGTCKGSAATITKEGQVIWTFEPSTLDMSKIEGSITEKLEKQNKYNELVASSTCAWTIEGAGKDGKALTTSGACGSDGKTVTATYASISKTGFAASIKLGDKTIPCGSVVVKGLPVTGCACTAPQTVDIATDPVGTWSVACASTNETITGYEWTDADGNGASATYTFTAPKQTRTPKVKVSTAESDTTVTCASPQKVYDSEHIDETMSWKANERLEPGFYTLTDCSSATGEKTVQVNGGSAADCNTWFGATSWSGGPWNTCNGQFKVTFPITLEVPEGGWVTLSNCW